MINVVVSDVQSLSGGTFGTGMGRIWLVDVQCTGEERMLMSCAANSSGDNSCTHIQDAGVRCPPGKKTVVV